MIYYRGSSVEVSMLVSSIAAFSAINTMNNSAYNMMNSSNSMMSLVRNAGTFGGEHNLSMLHEMDKRISLDLASNSLLYKLASLQEKWASKRQAQELERRKLAIKA